VIVYLHFALYELHTDLLNRAIDDGTSVTNQETLHSLSLADDTINSFGDGDVVVGDSLTLFFQSEREGTDGFIWDSIYYKSTGVDLSDISDRREDAIMTHIDDVLIPTNGLSNTEQSKKLGFTNVPFAWSLCNDAINLNTADNVGVGDFAFLGVVTSTQDVTSSQIQSDLKDYIESVEELRMPPSVGSFFQNFVIYKEDLDPYNGRYDDKDYPDPIVHGDFLTGSSTSNAMLGEFLTISAFNQDSSTNFAVDDQADAYGQYQNAQYNIEYTDDTLNAATGTEDVDGQKNNEKITYSRKLGFMGPMKLAVGEMLFTEHTLLVQFLDDHWNTGIYQEELAELKSDVCYEATGEFVHFIPQAPENPEVTVVGAAVIGS
jgi:hypothetical protein